MNDGVGEDLGANRKRMVGVAQLVRALGCGPGGCGFKSRLSPHFIRSSRDNGLVRDRRFRGGPLK